MYELTRTRRSRAMRQRHLKRRIEWRGYLRCPLHRTSFLCLPAAMPALPVAGTSYPQWCRHCHDYWLVEYTLRGAFIRPRVNAAPTLHALTMATREPDLSVLPEWAK